MYYQLIDAHKVFTDEDEIVLEDYRSGSYAVYRALNPKNIKLCYFQPDEEGSDERKEPRCDYILTNCNGVQNTRFVELKGIDRNIQKQCCKNEWNHAFHQLAETYNCYKQSLTESENIVFILCTSVDTEPSARYKSYAWYKVLCERTNATPIILLCNQSDEIYA